MAEILPNPRRSATIGGILKPVVQMIELLTATRPISDVQPVRLQFQKAPSAARRLRPLTVIRCGLIVSQAQEPCDLCYPMSLISTPRATLCSEWTTKSTNGARLCRTMIGILGGGAAADRTAHLALQHDAQSASALLECAFATL